MSDLSLTSSLGKTGDISRDKKFDPPFSAHAKSQIADPDSSCKSAVLAFFHSHPLSKASLRPFGAPFPFSPISPQCVEAKVAPHVKELSSPVRYHLLLLFVGGLPSIYSSVPMTWA